MKKEFFVAIAVFFAALALLPIFAAFEAHVINVTAEIENALSLTTEAIDFGTVFPQEHLKKPLAILLSGSFLEEDRVDGVNYIIRQKPKCGIVRENGQALVENSTKTGHVFVATTTPETVDYVIHCGEPLRALPSLCPYISKEDDKSPDNDGATPSFHKPFQIVDEAVEWLDTPGRLSKSEQDTEDNWTIDLAVPCFGGECAQDWADFVHKINPEADPGDYVQPKENEHKIFGCDLWVEVSSIESSFVENRDFLVVPTDFSIFELEDGTMIEAATYQIELSLEDDIDAPTLEALLDLVAQNGASVIGQMPDFRILQIGTPSKEVTISLLALLKNAPGVYAADLNSSVALRKDPSPPHYSCSDWADCDYWIDAINLRSAWAVTTGSNEHPIGIVDSGIDEDSGHFKDKQINVINPLWFNLVPGDSIGHGTFVASLATSRGDDGVLATGVAWKNPIIVADIEGVAAIGAGLFSSKTFLRVGIQSAIRNGAKIVNISLGPNPASEANEQNLLLVEQKFRSALTGAVRYARDHNALLVFAAGENNGIKHDDQYLPSGSREADIQAWRTNTLIVAYTEPCILCNPLGPFTKQILTNDTYEGNVIEIAAPGYGVGGAVAGVQNVIRAGFGTSFAAPIVTGVAALVWSVDPSLGAQQVKNIIVSNGISLQGNVSGGLVNAEAAVQAAAGIGTSTISVAKTPSDDLPIAIGGGSQTVGMMDVTVTGEPISVGKMRFRIVRDVAGSGDLSDIMLFGEDDNFVIGPWVINPVDLDDGSMEISWGEPVVFPTGTHTFTFKGMLPLDAEASDVYRFMVNPAADFENVQDMPSGNEIIPAPNVELELQTIKVG